MIRIIISIPKAITNQTLRRGISGLTLLHYVALCSIIHINDWYSVRVAEKKFIRARSREYARARTERPLARTNRKRDVKRTDGVLCDDRVMRSAGTSLTSNPLPSSSHAIP